MRIIGLRSKQVWTITTEFVCHVMKTCPLTLIKKFTILEVEAFIRKLPNGEAGGLDGLCNEMFKHCSSFLTPYIVDVFNGILDSGTSLKSGEKL